MRLWIFIVGLVIGGLVACLPSPYCQYAACSIMSAICGFALACILVGFLFVRVEKNGGPDIMQIVDRYTGNGR